MDFKSIKEKIIKFKDDAVISGSKKVAQSYIVIKNREDLDVFIGKSKNTYYTNKETGEKKENTRYIVTLFLKKDSTLYEEFLITMPILVAKAWAKSIPIKMCDMNLIDLSELKIIEQPSLVLFKNEKLVKIVTWEENIKTIVKKINLNIIEDIKNN